MGAPAETRGAAEVAEFLRIARGAKPVLLDGAAAMAWIPGGQVHVAYSFTIEGETIRAIDLIADPERLGAMDPVPVDPPTT